MSGREEEEFDFRTEEDSFPDDGEEFSLGLTDEEELTFDNEALPDTEGGPVDGLFTVSEEDVELDGENLPEEFLEEDDAPLEIEPDIEEASASEEGDEPLLFGGAEADEDGRGEDIFSPPPAGEPLPERRGSPARLLMLVLLVLLAGAVGFYLFTLPESGSGPHPADKGKAVATAKQPIAFPARPRSNNLPPVSGDPKPADSVSPAQPQADASPVPAKSTVPATSVASGGGKKVAPEKKLAASPAVDKSRVPAGIKAQGENSGPKKPAKVATAEMPEQTGKVVARPAPSARQKPSRKAAAAVASVPDATYRVQVGAFLLKSNLLAAEKKVRELGFQPLHSESARKTSVVRLKYGSFDEEEGRRKLAELKKLDADAFVLHEGERLGVYAGSYLDLDKARRFADILWEKGIKVEEVRAEVELPLHRLSFGGFKERKGAIKAAAAARKAGLDVQVIADRKS